MSKILAYGAGGALLVAGLALWFLWAHLQDAEREAHIWQQNATVAEQAALRNAQTAETLREEKRYAEAVAIKRQQENAELRQSEASLRQRLSTAKQEAPDEIRECLARPVPDSIDRLLREYPDLRPEGGDGQADPATGADAGL